MGVVYPSSPATFQGQDQLDLSRPAVKWGSPVFEWSRIPEVLSIIRGWAAYYRTQVSSDTFNSLDGYLWRLTYKWARLRHPNKSRAG